MRRGVEEFTHQPSILPFRREPRSSSAKSRTDLKAPSAHPLLLRPQPLRVTTAKACRPLVQHATTEQRDSPAPWSYDMLSGSGTNACHAAATCSPNAPCAAPKTLSPRRNGQPSGMGELSAMRPASSLPSTNGRGGWCWYLPCACRICMHAYVRGQRLGAGRQRAQTETDVEVVEPCAVDVDEDLVGADRGLGRVLRDRDLRGVGVVGHHERAHFDCSWCMGAPRGDVGERGAQQQGDLICASSSRVAFAILVSGRDVGLL